MLVNADRRGPKDMIDLANKAHAYKALLEAKTSNDAVRVNPDILFGDGVREQSQKKVDDAFEQFSDLHRHPETGKVDAGDMQATMNYLNQHIKKGKGL